MRIIKYKRGEKYINPRAVFYLAYGSNLYPSQFNERCPKNVFIGKINLSDYKLTFKRIGINYYATLEYEKGSYAPCALFAITRREKRLLDEYEGIGEAYNPLYIDNCVIDNKTYNHVLTYTMNDTMEYGLPNQLYLYKIKKGYENYDLDLKALKNSIKDVYETQKTIIEGRYNLCNEVLDKDIYLEIADESVVIN